MCTLSIIHTEKGIIFTHNRDENIGRPAATKPIWHTYKEKKLWFSMDPVGKGTWMATNGLDVVCLLNGAFEKHQWNGPYRISRGLVVLDLLASSSFKNFTDTYNFKNIEPFTLFSCSNNEINQLIWDGMVLHKKCVLEKSFIWSSSTLYDKETRDLRKTAFEQFLQNSELNEDSLFRFHTEANIGNDTNNFVMKRDNGIETLCVMQFSLLNKQLKVNYTDLINNTDLHVQIVC